MIQVINHACLYMEGLLFNAGLYISGMPTHVFFIFTHLLYRLKKDHRNRVYFGDVDL